VSEEIVGEMEEEMDVAGGGGRDVEFEGGVKA
jgi:hypothetical protein